MEVAKSGKQPHVGVFVLSSGSMLSVRQPQHAILRCELFCLASLPFRLRLDSPPPFHRRLYLSGYHLLQAILPVPHHGVASLALPVRGLELRAVCCTPLAGEPEENEAYDVDVAVGVVVDVMQIVPRGSPTTKKRSASFIEK